MVASGWRTPKLAPSGPPAPLAGPAAPPEPLPKQSKLTAQTSCACTCCACCLRLCDRGLALALLSTIRALLESVPIEAPLKAPIGRRPMRRTRRRPLFCSALAGPLSPTRRRGSPRPSDRPCGAQPMKALGGGVWLSGSKSQRERGHGISPDPGPHDGFDHLWRLGQAPGLRHKRQNPTQHLKLEVTRTKGIRRGMWVGGPLP